MPSSYVVLKGSIYHARYRIPKPAQWAFQKSELKFTLKTPNRDKALLIAKAFKSHLDRVIQNLEFKFDETNYEFTLTPLEQARIQNAIEQYINNSIAEYQYLASLNQQEFEEAMARLHFEKHQAALFIDALKTGDFSAPEIMVLAQDFLEDCPDRMRQFFGVPNKDYIYLARKLCHAHIHVVSQQEAIINGELSSSTNQSASPITQIIYTPQSESTVEVHEKPSLKLSEALPLFIAWKKHKKKSPSDSFIQEYEMQYGKFVAFFNDREVHTLTRQDINDYIEHLSSVHQKNGKPYSPETKNKYISKFRNVLAYIDREELASVNFSLEDLYFQEEQKGETKRDIFYADELQAFFSNDYYSGKKKFPFPSHYWTPLLILYTGLRPSEIAQLYTSDIVHIEGETWVILVMDEYVEEANKRSDIKYELSSDKKLKTNNAKRQVPIHPFLIEKGFIQYVEHLKEKGSILLFPNLTRNEKNGRAHNIVKWLSSHKSEFGWNEVQSQYSFRHTLLNALLEKGCPQEISRFIAGHSNDKDDTHRTYTKNYSYQPLIEVINAIDFNIGPLPWSELNYKYNVLTKVRSANQELLQG